MSSGEVAISDSISFLGLRQSPAEYERSHVALRTGGLLYKQPSPQTSTLPLAGRPVLVSVMSNKIVVSYNTYPCHVGERCGDANIPLEPTIYRAIIDDVVSAMKPDFDEYGVSEDVLAALQLVSTALGPLIVSFQV